MMESSSSGSQTPDYEKITGVCARLSFPQLCVLPGLTVVLVLSEQFMNNIVIFAFRASAERHHVQIIPKMFLLKNTTISPLFTSSIPRTFFFFFFFSFSVFAMHGSGPGLPDLPSVQFLKNKG